MALTIRKMTRADVEVLVRLHAAVFPAYDSTALGPSYLRALYRTLADHPATLSVIAEDEGEAVAWVGGILAYGPYYHTLIRRCWFRSPLLLWSALARRPALLARGLKFLAWYVRHRSPRSRPAVEGVGAENVAAEREAAAAAPRAPRWASLLVIGVAPGCQRRGVGQAIMAEFHAALKDAGFEEVRLSTFVDNESGNAAFRKAGYVLARTVGRVNHYVKKL